MQNEAIESLLVLRTIIHYSLIKKMEGVNEFETTLNAKEVKDKLAKIAVDLPIEKIQSYIDDQCKLMLISRVYKEDSGETIGYHLSCGYVIL